MSDTAVWDETKAAPHGRDENGVPKTPYGVNRDGSPRKSNRGARPGQKGTRSTRRRPAGVSVRNQTDKQRKEALCGLADMLVVMPLAGLSASPQLAGRIGPRHAEALAGDSVIVSRYMPHVADGLLVLSQTKPRALAWLDTVEEKAPYLMLANVGIQVARALVENHIHPNPDLATAGRLMAQMNAKAMADEIIREAERMGLPTDPDDFARQASSPNGDEPTIPIHTAN